MGARVCTGCMYADNVELSLSCMPMMATRLDLVANHWAELHAGDITFSCSMGPATGGCSNLATITAAKRPPFSGDPIPDIGSEQKCKEQCAVTSGCTSYSYDARPAHSNQGACVLLDEDCQLDATSTDWESSSQCAWNGTQLCCYAATLWVDICA